MDDTSAAAEHVVRDAIRRADPVTRMRRALEHSETMRELALARLRARHPDRTELALVELLIGARLVPDDEPHPTDDR